MDDTRQQALDGELRRTGEDDDDAARLTTRPVGRATHDALLDLHAADEHLSGLLRQRGGQAVTKARDGGDPELLAAINTAHGAWDRAIEATTVWQTALDGYPSRTNDGSASGAGVSRQGT